MDQGEFSDEEVFRARAELDCLAEEESWIAEDRVEECPPYWDTISCWPPTPEGSTAAIPCFKQLKGIFYDHSKFAHLACLSGSEWATRSDYNACVPLQLSEEGEEVWEVSYSSSLAHIYFSGYSVSLAALTTALLIFAYFKEMRCLRNKIHANLFLTFVLDCTFWMATDILQGRELPTTGLKVSWCVSLVLLRYFHLATFFWMFVEGLYLFVQVIATFSVEDSKMKFRHYFLIGWGLPLCIVTTWAVLTHQNLSDPRPSSECAFMERSNLEWIYIGPVLLLLATNMFFLVSIFTVVVTKLRATGERGEPADHQNWKAAKALLVIIPLLGITYIITILGPSDASTTSHILFVHLRAVLLSTQGFTVTLPYCFLNTEVRSILRHHWLRWRSARSVESRGSRSHRNSVSLAGCYGCDTHVTQLSSSRRNSFLRLHAQYLSSSSTREGGQLVTSVVLERNGLPVMPTNRVIPVIQEEHSSPLATSPLLPIPSPGSLTVRGPLLGQSNSLTLLDLSHSQPALLPGPISPALAAPPKLSRQGSHSCPEVNRGTTPPQ